MSRGPHRGCGWHRRGRALSRERSRAPYRWACFDGGRRGGAV